MKRIKWLIPLLILLPLYGAIAQQITKFAVIDTTRIYTTFYRDSRSVRDYETKKSRYQEEIQRMSDEIKQMRQQRVDAEAANDSSRASRLEQNVEKKTSFLLEYSKAKILNLICLRSVSLAIMIFILCYMKRFDSLPSRTVTAWFLLSMIIRP